VRGYYFPQFESTITTGVTPNAKRPIVQNNQIVYPYPGNRLHGVNIFGRLDFTVYQPLYAFGKISLREKAAEKNIQVKEAGVDAKRGEIIFRVAEAYYGLILANQGKEAVKEARTYLSDARSRVEKLLVIGSPSVKDTDKYRLALYEGSVEKAAAEAEEGAKVAYEALKAMTGMAPGQEFQVPQDLPNPSPPAGQLDYYVRQALELRPEFTQLKQGVVARQLLVDAARADQYPTFFLAVLGAVAGAPGREQSHDPYINDYFNQAYGFPVAGLKWNFDFGITKAKIRQAQAELDQLKYTEKAALMGIPLEVAQAYGKVQEGYKGARGLEKAYVNARRWLVTAFSNFDIGLGKMEDIFQAFERYGVSRGDYLMTLYNYSLAVAKLDKATGTYRRSQPKVEAKADAAGANAKNKK
jgi:outer membrane protein TolC